MKKYIRLKMKQKGILFVITVSVMLLAASVANAQTARILFYESSNVGKNYRISTGYSKFKEALELKGYSVERYEGTLSREDLENYNPDVLVIASLDKPLSAEELAAIFEFVMQDGKGLFICGGTQAANQLTIPFGMTIDPQGLLEDETSPVVDAKSIPSKDKTWFVVTTLERQDPSLRLLVQGINSLGFFGGNGISVSGDVKVVASGDWDTYSPKSSTFPKGSRPPIATAALVGNGMVFLLSDADMLTNDKIDAAKYRYDNLRFGTNIIDWLRSSTKRPPESVEVEELRVILGQLMVDLEAMNKSNKDLKETIKQKDSTINTLTENNKKLTEENNKLMSQTFMGINYMTWGIVLLAIAIIALAVVMSKKQKKEKKSEESGGGFGYEFDAGAGAATQNEAFGAKVESFDELMGMDKKK